MGERRYARKIRARLRGGAAKVCRWPRPADLLNAKEAAAILGCHPATVRRWADAGLIRCVRTPGGGLRFRRSVVEGRKPGGAA